MVAKAGAGPLRGPTAIPDPLSKDRPWVRRVKAAAAAAATGGVAAPAPAVADREHGFTSPRCDLRPLPRKSRGECMTGSWRVWCAPRRSCGRRGSRSATKRPG